MISKAVVEEMNEQIKHELYSAYLYLSMAAYFESSNMAGMAHWMTAQAKEEQEHALKFYGYIHDVGGKVVLQAIEQPPADFKSPLAVFEAALDHEKKVTARINHIYDVAVKNSDYASQNFLNWFLSEQIEEEKNATQIVEWLKMAGESANALMMVDSMLGKR